MARISDVSGVLLLVLTVTHVFYVSGQCTQIDSCSCFMPDGQVVDISTLGDNGGFAKFFAIPGPDGFYYSLNVCYPFNEGSCSGAAGCQTSADFLQTFQIGDAPTVTFSTDVSNKVHATYTSPADMGRVRTTDVLLECDQNVMDPQIQVFGEQGFDSLLYLFTITSRCACPGVCSESPIDPGHVKIEISIGISAGTVLCILFMVGLVVYIGGGMTYMRVRKQASGVNMLPNRDFWTAIPGLVKEGVLFTISKVRNVPSRKQYSDI